MALPVRKESGTPKRATDRTRNVTYAYTGSVKKNQAANDNTYSYPTNDNYKAANENLGRQTVDQSFRAGTNARTISGQPRNIERTMRQEPQEYEAESSGTARASYSAARGVARARGAVKMRKKSKLKASVRKTRAVRSSAMILSVGSIFAIFQFFIGTAYTLTFAILGAIESFQTRTDDQNVIVQIAQGILGAGTDLLLAISSALGFDVAGFFAIALGLSIVWTFITLICASAILYLNGYNAMGGKSAAAKQLTWIFVLISSTVPFLSMLPMTLAYVLVVFWKEK